MKYLFVVPAFLALLTVASSSVAHHSVSATYDAERSSSVQGIVTRFSFRNPHVVVGLEVTNADGSTTNWAAEGSAATVLRREGWTADTLEVGQFIQISGWATHDGSPMVTMDSVGLLNSDGSIASAIYGMTEDFSLTYETSLVELPLGLAENVPNLSGLWTGQGSPYAPPREPTIYFNEEGLAVLASFDVTDDPQIFCDTPGLIRQAGQTPHGVRITQHEDRVVFDYEEYGITKEVYFGSEIVNTGIKTHFGDSIARYENGALVVETINLLSELIVGVGHRLSDQATVVQTYTRVDEPGYSSLMKIQTLAKDPVYLEQDFELINIKMASADYDFIENGCIAPLRERAQVHPAMNLFLTSVGPGDGANLGGLEGADAHCASLAGNVGQGDKNWSAYLSTTGANGVNARDRIGSGPWYNAKGDIVAIDLDDLHGEALGFTKEAVVSESAQIINGRGDEPNRHDTLTGSLADGTASTSDSDTTCVNWTSNDAEGSALVGHFDRQGGGDNPTSWNSAHASRGCGQLDLQGTGGDGLFYCFAIDLP